MNLKSRALKPLHHRGCAIFKKLWLKVGQGQPEQRKTLSFAFPWPAVDFQPIRAPGGENSATDIMAGFSEEAASGDRSRIRGWPPATALLNQPIGANTAKLHIVGP